MNNDKDEAAGVDPAPFFQPRSTDELKATTLKDAVESVFDTLNMNVKSVLDTRHIIALVRGRVFAKKYNSKLMELLCQQLLEMRVSLKGRGRKDLLATLQSAMRSEERERHLDEKTKAGRLFGS